MSYQRVSYVTMVCVAAHFSDELKFNECISDKGVNNSVR